MGGIAQGDFQQASLIAGFLSLYIICLASNIGLKTGAILASRGEMVSLVAALGSASSTSQKLNIKVDKEEDSSSSGPLDIYYKHSDFKKKAKKSASGSDESEDIEGTSSNDGLPNGEGHSGKRGATGDDGAAKKKAKKAKGEKKSESPVE